MDSLYGRRALTALRPATEAGVDLTYPRGRRLADYGGSDLLVTKRIARANDHPMPLPSLTQQIAGQGRSLHGARARRCFAGHTCNAELRTGRHFAVPHQPRGYGGINALADSRTTTLPTEAGCWMIGN